MFLCLGKVYKQERLENTMRMTFSESARVTEELNSLASTWKKRISGYREKEEEGVNQKFFCMLRIFFKNWRLLGKAKISTADISDFENEDRLENIYEKVLNKINISLDQSVETQTPYTSVFNLYYEIIEQITNEGKWKLHVAQYTAHLIGVATIFGAFDMLDKFAKSGNEPWATRYKILQLVLVFSGFVAARTCRTYAERKLIKIKIKTKNTLMIMVYYKLIISDQNFLESSDNNLIYRLFYWDLDAYASYGGTLNYYIVLFVQGLVQLIYLKVAMPESPYNYMMLVITVSQIFVLIFSFLRAVLYWQYRDLLTKEREVIYEWFYSLKDILSANLKAKYEQRLTGLGQVKNKILNHWYRVSSVLLNISSFTPAMSSLVLLMIIFIGNYQYLQLGNTVDQNHQSAQGVTLSLLFGSVCLEKYLSLENSRFSEQLQAWMLKNASTKFYNQFFGSHFLIQKAPVLDVTMGIGEIDIQGCDVYERDYPESVENFDGLFRTNSTIPETKTVRSAETKLEGETTQEAGNSSEAESEGQNLTGTIRQVVKNLTLKIRSGDIVCVVLNKQTAAISGFMKFLLGENIITEGTMRYNGEINFFSRVKMPILAGKTIRDNILFGEDFNMDRYEEILKVVGVNFDKYNGRDFYQVSEKGSNLRSDDHINLLLARFIYRDSNIYIAEDMFVDMSPNSVEYIVTRILQGFLVGKTVIYVSKLKRLREMATIQISFGSNYNYKIIRPEKLSIIGLASVNEESKTKRVFTSLGKISNSIFIENATYEEDLAIHKKLLQQKKEIESKIKETTNIVEKIAYGIYLTNKRRQEGQNLQEYQNLKWEELVRFNMDLLVRNKAFRRAIILTMLYMITKIAVITATEYQILVKSWHRDDLTILLDSYRLWSIAILFGCSLVLSLSQTFVITKLYMALVEETHDRILYSIFHSQFYWINRMKFHDILSRTNEHMKTLNTDFIEGLFRICEQLAWVLILAGCTMWIYSIVVPLIIIIIYFICLGYGFIRLLPGYFRALSFMNSTQYKKDDFNFLLLSNIFGHRTTGLIKKLNRRFLKLSDNLARCEKLVFVEYRQLFMSYQNLLKVFMGVCLFSLFFLYVDDAHGLNFFKKSKLDFMWCLLQFYKLSNILEDLVLLILNFFSQSLSLHGVFAFLEASREYNEIKPKSIYFRKPQPDYSRPLVLRNVSLTLGYRPVLKKVSMKVAPATRVGLVGVEGSGRSSIFDLIAGMKTRDPKVNSEIYIFGIRVEEFTSPSLRKDILIMGKAPCLFEGTIRQNIDPYGNFTDEQIIEVIRSLGIEKILRREILRNQIELKKTGTLSNWGKIAEQNTEKPMEFTSPSHNKIMPTTKTNYRIVQSHGNMDKIDSERYHLNELDKVENHEFDFENKANQGIKLHYLDKPMANIVKKEGTALGRRPINPSKKNQIKVLVKSEVKKHIPGNFGTQEKLDELPEKPNLIAMPSEKVIPKKSSIIYSKRARNMSVDNFTNKLFPNAFSDDSSDIEDEKSGLEQATPGRYKSTTSFGFRRKTTRFELTSDANLNEFLNLRVLFAGKNINKKIKHVVAFARTILEKPKLLMLYEGAINWGAGAASNLEILKRYSPETTVLSITKFNREVFCYDHVVLIDGGMVIDQGNPMALFRQESSRFYNYLKETDQEVFQLLNDRLTIKEENHSFSLEKP